MTTHFLGWWNKWTGKSGRYSQTFKSVDEARREKSVKNGKHVNRKHWVVTRTGGRDGR